MKKNLLYLVVLLVLLGVAGWILSDTPEKSTLEGPENYAFNFPDTAAISKIVISSKKPSKAVLIRKPEGWRLEGKYPVRRDAMETLMRTLNRMQMRNFVPQRQQESILRHMASEAKKVEIYHGDKLYKTIYVGTETGDQLGTYMMLKDGDAPYAVHLPGFNGFLNTRFMAEPHLWRRRDIFSIAPRHIREVKMVFPDSLNQSYRLRVFSPDSLYFIRSQDDKVIRDFSNTKARLFLSAFKNARYEAAIVPSDPIYRKQDSLKASTPYFRLRVQDFSGKVNTLTAYRIKGEPQTFDPEKPETRFDPDRLHGFINGERMVLLQFYGLRNILLPLSYFREVPAG